MTPNQLPPLPEPFALSVSVHDGETPEKTYVECLLYQKHPNEKQRVYTADQMHAYALAALAQQAQEPVYQLQLSSGGWIDLSENQYNYNKAHESNVVRILYTTPQPQPAPSPQAPGRRQGPPGITLEPQGHDQPAVPAPSLAASAEDMAVYDGIAKRYFSDAKPAPLAGEVTDEQIIDIATQWSNKEFAEGAWRFCTDFARAILALRQQAVPMIPLGFRVSHNPDWCALTDEVNAGSRWTVERNDAPYEGASRKRMWKGRTLADAMAAALADLGITAKAEGGAQ